MGSPLSSDLRERVVKAVSEGASRRQAAERFGVSPASAIRWQESFEREGRVAGVSVADRDFADIHTHFPPPFPAHPHGPGKRDPERL